MQLSEQQKEAMTTVNGQVILISCPGQWKNIHCCTQGTVYGWTGNPC